jgi:hypothetical protein
MSFRTFTACLLTALPLAVAGVGSGQERRPAPTAPAPNLESTQPTAGDESAEPVVGQLEHSGWGLVGSRGRHYVFGGLAVADYSRGGQRQVVTLQQEEPSLLPKPDENYLYYRELGTGDRWAIGRHPQADETYLVYFQPRAKSRAAGEANAVARPKWTLFHRARLIWPEQEDETAAGNPQIPQNTQMMKANCRGAP